MGGPGGIALETYAVMASQLGASSPSYNVVMAHGQTLHRQHEHAMQQCM